MIRSRMPIYLTVITAMAILIGGDSGADAPKVQGVVFEDRDGTGEQAPDEPGIPGVLVSNQFAVTITDANGRYELPAREESFIYVHKPAGYALPLDEYNLPQFYYLHQPDGSPDFLESPGVEPTGPLPGRLDFPLRPKSPAHTFDILSIADPQVRTMEHVHQYREDVVSELAGSDADFALILGDLVGDLNLCGPYKEATAFLGITVFNVPGNHELNYEAPDNRHSLETYKRYFGPQYYSFTWGSTHFIVLDSMDWSYHEDHDRNLCFGMVDDTQKEWLTNLLEYLPKSDQIVLASHIPFVSVVGDGGGFVINNREEILALFENHKRVLALAGHHHTIEHSFGSPDFGWTGDGDFHQMLSGAASGSWWSGPTDLRGIASRVMGDGTPPGYHRIRFSEEGYTERYLAFGHHPDYQMRIIAPHWDPTEESSDDVVVNVFNGHSGWTIEWSLNGEEFESMHQEEPMIEPWVTALHKSRPDEFPEWIQNLLQERVWQTQHIWSASLPNDLETGLHDLRVRAADPYGNTFKAVRLFERVSENAE